MKNFLTGAVTAMVTPFDGKKLALKVFEALLEAQIEAGVGGVVVLGSTGEPCALTQRERDELIGCAVSKARGRVKVLVGTGSNDPKKAVLQSKRAEKLGADGLLVVTPYYNKCTQEGLFDYYKAISKAVALPIVCYNVPARTGVNLLPETMARIAKLPSIVGLKEASGNLLQVQEALRLLPNGFEVYSGDDALNFPVLALGGKAVISVVSNLAPQKVVALCRAVETGDLALARTLNFGLASLCKACFCEVNPIPVKAGLELMGYPVGAPRPPLTPLSKEKAALLFAAMQESKIL